MSRSVLAFLFLCLTLVKADETVKDLVNTTSCTNCFTLNNGVTIPVVGLGTSRIGSTDEAVITAIKDGVNEGYRHIDTAFFYQNEEAIGKALEELFQAGKLKREDIFITTKVWSHEHTEELALNSVRRSLERMKLTYLDLVLVHWPFTFQSGGETLPRAANGTIMSATNLTEQNYKLAYKGLEKAVRLNLTRSIGVSNFNVKQIEDIVAVASIKPVLNQVESHPLLSQQDLLAVCTRNGIRLEAYSPLRRGDSELLQNETLKKIAAKYERTVAQVMLRWQVQRGVIVIPRSSKAKRMRENKDLFGFALTEAEVNTINGLNTNDRAIKFEEARNLPEYPF